MQTVTFYFTFLQRLRTSWVLTNVFITFLNVFYILPHFYAFNVFFLQFFNQHFFTYTVTDRRTDRRTDGRHARSISAKNDDDDDRETSLTVGVVANSLAGYGGGRRAGAGARRQAVGGRAGAERGRADRLQRQRGQRRDGDAEDAADRVAGGRGRRRADEGGGRRRRQTARRLRGLMRRLRAVMMVVMMMMMMLRRHRLLGFLGRLVANDPARTHPSTIYFQLCAKSNDNSNHKFRPVLR